jgi:hypothetical protein
VGGEEAVGPVVPGGLIPVEANDPRVTDAFAALGEMYEIPGLGILSGSSRIKMTWNVAFGDGNYGRGFCQQFGEGARMLTDGEWEMVARSMGKGTPADYNRDRIPDIAGKLFWSSVLYRDDVAKAFRGNDGNVFNAFDCNLYHVSCVVPF